MLLLTAFTRFEVIDNDCSLSLIGKNTVFLSFQLSYQTICSRSSNYLEIFNRRVPLCHLDVARRHLNSTDTFGDDLCSHKSTFSKHDPTLFQIFMNFVQFILQHFIALQLFFQSRQSFVLLTVHDLLNFVGRQGQSISFSLFDELLIIIFDAQHFLFLVKQILSDTMYSFTSYFLIKTECMFNPFSFDCKNIFSFVLFIQFRQMHQSQIESIEEII